MINIIGEYIAQAL